MTCNLHVNMIWLIDT